ncbi:tape measure protein [Aurantimonas phage AmM-1]|uniref:tail length tape measure protein n=1 Tax=Aurantimonas phage AmM-1 TaxID=1503929 RepID=UPI000540D321|nr:tail length tape measure protein [Aurantimonas phage AmM-1]BAP94481.1 tape measure protein [Aurantimonas phage AmM-1]
MARLTAELVATLTDRVSAQARSIERSLDRMERTQGRATRGMTRGAVAGGRMSGALGMMAARAGAVAGPLAAAFGAREIVDSAADFETALTGIQKKAGTTAAETAAIGEEIKALATSGDLAVPINEIASAYERGAAAGIPIAELKEFARLSAMAADAFEMSAEDVGNAAAGFQTNLGVPISEMERFFDLINGLADAGIADESEIVTFLDRAGAKLKSFGLGIEESAALGASLLNLKMPADVAARAMDTLTTKLLTPNATKTSRKAFEELYGSTEAITELLREDTNGALLDFLKRIDSLDKFKRAELLTDILGQGFSGEVGALAGGLGEVIRNLEYARGQDWFGSLSKSYQLKLDDLSAQWQLTKNSLEELAIDLGTMGMPAFKAGLEGARTLIAEIQAGMAQLEMEVDWTQVDEAKAAVGELGETIGDLMGIDASESLLGNSISDIATMIEQASSVIKTVSGELNDALEFIQDPAAYMRKDRSEESMERYGIRLLTPEEQEAIAEEKRKKYREKVARGRQELSRWAMGENDSPPIEPHHRVPRGPRQVMPQLAYPSTVPPGLTSTIPIPQAAPRGGGGAEATAARIREIDQALGDLLATKRQVEEGFAIAPSGDAAGTMRQIADEMQRLMDLRRQLESGGPNIAAPVEEEAARASQAARTAAQDIMTALSLTVRPHVDPGSVDGFLSKVRQARTELASLQADARRAQDAVASTRADYSGLHADLERAG